MRRALLVIGMGLCAAAAAQQGAPGETAAAAPAPDMGIHGPRDIAWQPGPPSLPPGAHFALLEGDPRRDGLFVMRLRLPDGYRIPPHWHPKVERVTVVSGVFNLGMGEVFDRSATREMTAGTFGYWPPGMRHFAWARGETVLQLHGVGPWQITYVNPADDPRKPAP